MLGSHKVRRLTALLAIASITNAAGFVSAQQPVAKPSTGAKTPKRVALGECDYTEGGCGGEQTFPGTGDGSSGSGGTSDGGEADDCCRFGNVPSGPTCTSGTANPCRTETVTTCTEWVYSSGGGGVTVQTGPNPGGGVNTNATRTCASATTTTKTWYWSAK